MSANVGATRNRTDVFLKYRNQARSGSRPLGTGLPGSPSKASDKYVPEPGTTIASQAYLHYV